MTLELRQRLRGLGAARGRSSCAARRAASSTTRWTGWRSCMAERAGLPPLQQRWWGWGDPAHVAPVAAHALAWLSERLGEVGPPRAPVALDDVRLDPRRAARGGGRPAGGDRRGEHVRDDREARVVHAAGKGYPDLVRLRAGEPEGAPDAVVLPGGHDEVARGAGRVRPGRRGGRAVRRRHERRGRRGAAARATTPRWSRWTSRAWTGSSTSTSARRSRGVGAGTRAPALEAALAERGLTLGHFPQSYEYVVGRRLRGDALGGPGLDGLRADRRTWSRACGPSPRRATWTCRRSPPRPPGRTCASCSSAPRARSAC